MQVEVQAEVQVEVQASEQLRAAGVTAQEEYELQAQGENVEMKEEWIAAQLEQEEHEQLE